MPQGSPIDLSYWQRGVDQLREKYRKREKFASFVKTIVFIQERVETPSSRELRESDLLSIH